MTHATARLPGAPAVHDTVPRTPFTVRRAASRADRDAVYHLRRAVFGPHVPDADRFDAVCDHLMILDRATGALAGTARLQRADLARHGFYTQAEFDVAPLLARHSGLKFCEVGRTCIAHSYRRGAAVNALWAGLSAYAREHGIDVYFGTASFPGTDPAAHAGALSMLAAEAPAQPGWDVRAHPGRAVPMGAVRAAAPGWRRRLPPLVRGYLALGAHFAPEAVIDPDFRTLDVLVIARLSQAPAAHRAHFSYSSSKHA